MVLSCFVLFVCLFVFVFVVLFGFFVSLQSESDWESSHMHLR